MKTTRGKTAILRSVGGLTGLFGQAIAIGLGNSAESATSMRLDHEVVRVPVDFVGIDEIANLVIFKGTLPDYLDCKYTEAGLYNALTDESAGGFGSRVVFNSIEIENWVMGTNAAFETGNARTGGQTVTLRPVASATTSAAAAVQQDFSGYSSADLFNLAYTVDNAFSSAINVRLYTDASNHYTLSFSPVTAGTRIATATKGSAVVTGTPDWANITSIEVRATATAGGTAGVSFDSLRIEDSDTLDSAYTLVDRKVFTTVTKVAGRPREIEFAVEVTL